MKIVVGGSYHNPNWDEVKKVMEKLEEAGHEVIAPGTEWEPININDEFVKFMGENDIPRELLQDEFMRKINQDADAFVAVDSNGYLGYTVTFELIYAILLNLALHRRFLVYFTEEPAIFQIIEKGTPTPYFFPNGKQMKGVGPDELLAELKKRGVSITQEEYDKLYPFHYKFLPITLEWERKRYHICVGRHKTCPYIT